MVKKGRLSYNRTRRLKTLVKNMLRMYKVKCFFCHNLLVESDPLKITVHHMNGDHNDDDPENLALSHEKCHRGHHAKLNLHKKKEESTIEQSLEEYSTIDV